MIFKYIVDSGHIYIYMYMEEVEHHHIALSDDCVFLC